MSELCVSGLFHWSHASGLAADDSELTLKT
jgi:hypothetical protein